MSPFRIRQVNGYEVRSPKGVKGKHKSLASARAQQRAIYAHWKGEGRKKS